MIPGAGWGPCSSPPPTSHSRAGAPAPQTCHCSPVPPGHGQGSRRAGRVLRQRPPPMRRGSSSLAAGPPCTPSACVTPTPLGAGVSPTLLPRCPFPCSSIKRESSTAWLWVGHPSAGGQTGGAAGGSQGPGGYVWESGDTLVCVPRAPCGVSRSPRWVSVMGGSASPPWSARPSARGRRRALPAPPRDPPQCRGRGALWGGEDGGAQRGKDGGGGEGGLAGRGGSRAWGADWDGCRAEGSFWVGGSGRVGVLGWGRRSGSGGSGWAGGGRAGRDRGWERGLGWGYGPGSSSEGSV